MLLRILSSDLSQSPAKTPTKIQNPKKKKKKKKKRERDKQVNVFTEQSAIRVRIFFETEENQD